ncbi:MAG: hypothetical protein IKG40_02760 [Bacilli bacterium]|nr:hypothetical protein [Bacilli bacterium]
MKKNNNKGFLLVETLVVSTFCLTVLVVLFLQFKTLIINYNDSFKYNTVEGIYSLNEVKKYLQNNDVKLDANSAPYYVTLKDDNGVNNEICNELCDELLKSMEVKTIIYTSSNIDGSLRNNNNLSENTRKFISRLKNNDKGNRLIAEFKNGTYASITYSESGEIEETKTIEESSVTYINGAIYRWPTNANNVVDTWNNGKDISNLKEGIDYVRNPSTLGKTYYLKYEVEYDWVAKSYVCFVYNNSEHCMLGGDGGKSFAANTQIIKDFQKAKGLYTVNQPTASGCRYTQTVSTCNGGGFGQIHLMSDGSVRVVSNSGGQCAVGSDGFSSCY